MARPVSWATALRAVAEMRSAPDHRRVPDDVDLVGGEVATRARVLGHRQVTDAHLVEIVPSA